MKVPVALLFTSLLSASLLSICLFSCQSPAANASGGDSASTNKPGSVSLTGHNPEFRKTVKKEPVATYREKTDNPLNDWYFTVQVFETPKTMKYLLTMQFEEVRGQDTLELPDFGNPPKPVLQKGKDKYSCVVGFLDNDNKFREYKLVYVKDGNSLKLATLRHYSVSTEAE